MAKEEKEVQLVEEKIQEVSVLEVMPRKFLNYAMSVNISRSIPDVRDGLKPVHRRILYAMNALGMTPGSAYKKSARIVGEVIGKYHPHGDSSVYEAMVRLAQDFSMSERLVDGHGNFGSIDGDSAAAMRYTEARLHKNAMELLRDLRPEVVPYEDNYDGAEREPSVLPGRFPNMLVNGTEGIGVGMATKLAPHNLREVCQAIIAQIDNPEITIPELMEYIPGPDFPTHAVITGTEGIKKAYLTGKGTVRIRSKAEIVDNGKYANIIITEIPYQVNKQKLVEKIDELHKEALEEQDKSKKNNKAVHQNGRKKLLAFLGRDGVRDESDRNGMRIVVELRKDVNPQVVLNYLFKNTELETTFSINMNVLIPKRENGNIVGKQAKVLNLKEMIQEYIAHQLIVETNQQRYLLSVQEKDLIETTAIIKALDRLDETIETIRGAKSKDDAIQDLMVLLDVTEQQATIIIRARLHMLVNMEQDIEREKHQKILDEIARLEGIIADENKVYDIIKERLLHYKEKFGCVRRTRIQEHEEYIDIEDTIQNDEVVITTTQDGFIKRTLESAYRVQRRNGRGVNGMNMFDDDFINDLHIARNHDHLLFFTNYGRVYKLKAWEIPEHPVRHRGVSIRSLLDFADGEAIQAVLPVFEFTDTQHILFATKNGTVKKTVLSDYKNIRRSGIAAITLDQEKEDRVVGVSLTDGQKLITLITEKGISITFDEGQVNSIGRTGKGVKGIDLKEDDSVISLVVHQGEENSYLLVATNEGFGKRTTLSSFRVQHRGGKGVICIKLTDKTGRVIDSITGQEMDCLLLMTKGGTVMKVKISDISSFSRNTQGSRIMNLRDEDELYTIARILDNDEEETDEVENEETEEATESAEDDTQE